MGAARREKDSLAFGADEGADAGDRYARALALELLLDDAATVAKWERGEACPIRGLRERRGTLLVPCRNSSHCGWDTVSIEP